VTHLLDSSALLAHYFGERGSEKVRKLFDDEDTPILLSVLSAAEFWGRLRSEGHEASFENEWKLQQTLFDRILEVDWAVTERAIAIRRATPTRLPMVDTLIAATASLHNAVLVHRDPHFRAIPSSLLHQLDLDKCHVLIKS
jgi:predicted nucleic acid-binding protein